MIGMVRNWWKSREAHYQAESLREQVAARKHQRASELVAKPYKSLSELSELELYEAEMRFVGMNDSSAMWQDRLNIFRDFNRGGLGNPRVTDHTNRKGADFPFFTNEVEHAVHRDASRILCGTDPNAIGLLTGLESYTVGKGSMVRVKARRPEYETDAKLAQAVIDSCMRANRWAHREKERFRRTIRDGDSILRLFPQTDGTTRIRFVWPEQLRQPTGTQAGEWAFGIQTDPSDVETVLNYAIYPTEGDTATPEIVPANEIVHIKINTDTGVRVGLPDFAFSTLDVLNDADKLCDNMGVGSAIQAAIAYIRQHTGVPATSIRAFASQDKSFAKPDPWTGQDNYAKKMSTPGQVVDTNENTEFLSSPYNAGISSHLEVAAMLHRRACVRWNAPEWLGSADASNNNFASSLTAESPFVLRVESNQTIYRDADIDLWSRVLAIAAAIGEHNLPRDILNRVDIDVTYPCPVARDRIAEANRSTIQIQGGWKSPQTAAAEDGLDFAEEMRERAEAVRMGWVPPTAPTTVAASKVPQTST